MDIHILCPLQEIGLMFRHQDAYHHKVYTVYSYYLNKVNLQLSSSKVRCSPFFSGKKIWDHLGHRRILCVFFSLFLLYHLQLSINCYHRIYLTYTAHSFANLIYHNRCPLWKKRGWGSREVLRENFHVRLEVAYRFWKLCLWYNMNHVNMASANYALNYYITAQTWSRNFI
jgi:hypothetical protein